MKKTLLLICLAGLAIISRAQTFTAHQALNLPDSLSAVIAVEPADIDLDGLQDLLIFTTSPNGKYLLFVKGDTVNAPVLQSTARLLPDYSRYVLADADMDNQLDIILAIPGKTIILHNLGDFNFSEMETSLPEFSALHLTDLDGDGRRACIVSGIENGSSFTRTYTQTESSGWVVAHDSLTVGLSVIESVDLDGNGRKDLFFSGKENDGSAFTSIFIRTEKGFQERRIFSVEVSTAVVDSDLDGRLDLIAYGVTGTGDPFYQRIPGDVNLAPENLGPSGRVLSAFHADLDSDGMPDQHTLTVTSTNDTLNIVRFHDGRQEVISHKNLVQQVFYDVDQDGDLDFVQLTSGPEMKITWHQNITPSKNRGPAKFNVAAIPVFDRVLMYWNKSEDDHTASASITYDVYLEGKTINQDVSFDLANGRRIRPEHGNNGTNNFLLLRSNNEEFNYAIQGVDNSLFGSPEGICFGNSAPCAEPEHQVIAVCTTESVLLKAPDDALWFSFSKGFLGTSSSYHYEPLSKDTVFYLLPKEECPVVRTFEFKMQEGVEHLEPENHFVCVGNDITLEIDDTFSAIRWSSENQGILGETATMNFKTEVDDVVRLTYKNDMQCDVVKDFVIRMSIPTVAVSPPEHRMMKGQSVQLSVTGAESYSWSPSAGLNNAQVANPIASPSTDTRYTVTGTDSIGCTASAVVDIAVESTGFIPSLFTPNGDGQNDLLKVYGLAGVNDFTLRIVNREGSVVFRTTSIAEAAGRGWNGETNGIQQPNGVYFWKVEGRLASGNKVLLNGKEEGSLVLLR